MCTRPKVVIAMINMMEYNQYLSIDLLEHKKSKTSEALLFVYAENIFELKFC